MGISPAMAARIANATATQNGIYIKPGKYLFEVQRILMGGRTETFFIAELVVLEAQQTDPKEAPNAVGTQCSLAIDLAVSPKGESGPGNAKAFVEAMLGPGQVSQDSVLEALSDAQPLMFFKVRDEAYQKPQKKDPTKMFTYHKWEHVPPTDADFAQIIARRNALKAAAK